MVNLSESIAVTQNFVPPAHLPSVLRFLKTKQDQISGFADEVEAYKLFIERLAAEYPHLLKKGDSEVQSKKRKWAEESESSDFSFNFFS